MIGSGAWASAAVRMVAQNTMGAKSGAMFQDKVAMWVRAGKYEVSEERAVLSKAHHPSPSTLISYCSIQAQGGQLTEIINETHENPK